MPCNAVAQSTATVVVDVAEDYDKFTTKERGRLVELIYKVCRDVDVQFDWERKGQIRLLRIQLLSTRWDNDSPEMKKARAVVEKFMAVRRQVKIAAVVSKFAKVNESETAPNGASILRITF